MKTPARAHTKRKKTPFTAIEDIFILLCILVLWPTIVGWQAPVYTVLRYVALAGLLWIFVRRVRAIRAHGHGTDGAETNETR